MPERKLRTREVIECEWERQTGAPPAADHWKFAALYCEEFSAAAERSASAMGALHIKGAKATIAGHHRYWKAAASGLRWAASLAHKAAGKVTA